MAYGVSFTEAITKDRGQPSTVRIGVVATVNPLTVQIQNTVVTNVGALNGVNLVVGDTVALLGQSAVSADGSSWLALGNVMASSAVGGLYDNGVQVMGPNIGNNTGAFVTLTGATFQWRKLRTNSRVLASIAISSFSSAVGLGVEFGAQLVDNAAVLTSVDFALASFFFNITGAHLSCAGFRYLAAATVPAGSYTVNARFRLYAGAGTVTVDGNDRISLGFTEID